MRNYTGIYYTVQVGRLVTRFPSNIYVIFQLTADFLSLLDCNLGFDLYNGYAETKGKKKIKVLFLSVSS